MADTSFLYALFSRGDTLHDRAIRAAERIAAFAVPAEIYAETIALIHYRQGFGAARAAGNWLRAQPQVDIGVGTEETLAEAWWAYVRGAGRLSYPDSVVVAWCHRRGFTPLAYDSRILAQARK